METPKKPPTFRSWMTAQVHRIDEIGLLARQWIEVFPGCNEDDFTSWIEARRESLILKANIESAEEEYIKAIDDLRQGRKTPTFPDWLFRMESDQAWATSSVAHRQHPEITASQYLHSLHLELMADIHRQTVIYIDTCHWVKMRHWLLDDKKKSTVYSNILNRLRALRNQRKAICPVAYPIFIELMKQSDSITRVATAKLMDELSDSVCLKSLKELVEIEIRKVIRGKMFGNQVSNTTGLVWTKSSCILGERLPFNKAFSKADNTYIQKSFLDVIWGKRLEDVIDSLDQATFPHIDDQKVAAAYNKDATHFRDNKISFDKILESEKVIEWQLHFREPFIRIAEEFESQYPDHAAKVAQTKESNQRSDAYVFPTLQILAGINTLFISSRQSFKPSDIRDAQHSALALPYYDIFLCDGGMAQKLIRKPLRLSDTYNTKVLSNPEEILSTLESL